MIVSIILQIVPNSYDSDASDPNDILAMLQGFSIPQVTLVFGAICGIKVRTFDYRVQLPIYKLIELPHNMMALDHVKSCSSPT